MPVLNHPCDLSNKSRARALCCGKTFKRFKSIKKRSEIKEKENSVKKTGIAVFCLLSLFVLLSIETAVAYNAAYTHTLYQADAPPTIDGTYSLNTDWVASLAQPFGTNGIFRDEWTMTPNYACLLIETADSTNDPGDYWVICYDSTASGGETPPDGGPAPTAYDYKLNITGHGASATVQWYKGTGSAWTPVTPSTGLLTQAQSLSSTPLIAAPHYVLELYVDKSDTSLGGPPMGYNWAQYVAYYDAHAGGYGLQSWPPASANPPGSPNVPDSWGYIPYAMGANPTPDIPESIGIVAVISVSSVAIAGGMLIRKRQRILTK